eukprot:PITA_01561
MLHDQSLPFHLWAEACNTTIYLQNRSPHRILGMKTPMEAFSGKRPDVSHFRIFGPSVYCHVTKDARKKLDPTVELGILVGYIETPHNYQRRQRRSPEQYTSYMALVGECVEIEPSSFEEAVQRPVRVDAMVEYDSIVQNYVWDVVPRPEDKLVVSFRWLYKVKQAADGSFEKHKARFVARGFSQVEGIDYN